MSKKLIDSCNDQMELQWQHYSLLLNNHSSKMKKIIYEIKTDGNRSLTSIIAGKFSTAYSTMDTFISAGTLTAVGFNTA